MHPALSIIFFTAVSGAGFGALAAAGILDALIPGRGVDIALVIGFVLAGTGLSGAVLHLQSPTRARFALSQWRTSWLSREGVLSIITMGLAFVLIAPRLVGMETDGTAARVGVTVLLPVLSAATVWCTGMIYQSIRAVPAWSGQPASLGFLLFAASGGALIVLASAGEASNMGYGLALFFLFVAWYVKTVIWGRIDKAEPTATVASATGLPAEGLRLFERPHVTENWLTREMGFRVARRHATKLRGMALLVGGVLPAVLIALPLAGIGPHALAWLAAVLHVGGVLVERWLFFAEARHVQTLYYGAQAV